MMLILKHTSRNYILYSLSCLLILAASITLILSLYRLQRDASLLNREVKRDYVTNKINKSFPTIAIIISIIVCLSSILSFIIVFINGRTELLIISIVSNIILGLGLIVLSIIKLGFVQNIVDNFPVDIERLLVDFIVYNKTSARDELLQIEDSNDCCTTQHPIWINEYTRAAECNREQRFRILYADQDEQRGCVKVITQTALSFMPVLISEVICGCLCLLLALWSIYIICQINSRYNSLVSNNEPVKVPSTTLPETDYYQSNKTIYSPVPEMKINDDQTNKLIDNNTIARHSYPMMPLNKIDKSLYTNTILS